MVRRRASAVSNHEGPALTCCPSFETRTKSALLQDEGRTTRPYTIPAATWPRSRSRPSSVLAQASATSTPLMAKCLRKKS